MPHISLEEALPEIEKHIPNVRVFQNFKKCLQSFGYQSKGDNLAEFFELVVDRPERFRDTSNFPVTWHSNNSFVTGLSSIHRALECPSIRQLFSPARFAAIEKGILDYMRDLKGDAPVSSPAEVRPTAEPVKAVEAVVEHQETGKNQIAYPGEVREAEDADEAFSKITSTSTSASEGEGAQAPMFEYMLRLLDISQHTLDERNQTVDRLLQENKALRKQVHDLEAAQRTLENRDRITWLQKKLDVCLQYIRDSADKDPALTQAFMQLSASC